tara:strand:+ start:443 stop:589 length:147 start_codon:yes stop_codon:yes gene_type:complete
MNRRITNSSHQLLPPAKREIIQLIHKIIKNNVLERNQKRKIDEIKNVK